MMKQIPVYLDEEIPKLQKRIAELEAKLAIAIDALEARNKELEALAEQPTQEPYGWVYEECIDDPDHAIGYFYSEAFSWIELKNGTPVYTHPKQWQGLSDEDIKYIAYKYANELDKLREKNDE